MATNTANTAGRFGARYGKKTRENTAGVESQYRKRNTCPACRADALTRVAAGIWKCRKCDTKTAGKAYTPPSTIDRSVTREDVETVLNPEEAEEAEEVSAEQESEGDEENSEEVEA